MRHIVQRSERRQIRSHNHSRFLQTFYMVDKYEKNQFT